MTTGDTFSAMLISQSRLQAEAYGHDFASMDNEARIEFIKINVLALTDELHEALQEVGWKPWATSRFINQEAYEGELVDAFHFFLNLMLAVGLDPMQFMSKFAAKQEKNRQRQIEGYDGQTSKCPRCQRAMDDAAVHCTIDTVALYADHATEIIGIRTVGGQCDSYGAWVAA